MLAFLESACYDGSLNSRTYFKESIMAKSSGIFYGWIVVGAACFCYGLGISPAYYGFPTFADDIIETLNFSREDYGSIFGLFVFLYSAASPLAGLLQSKIGIRNTMVAGALLAAAGFLVVSQAHDKTGFFIGFSVLGGLGVGLSTIVPTQTLGQNWFLKRRATAIALIMCAGGIVGPGVTLSAQWTMDNLAGGWRTGLMGMSAVSIVVAIVAFFFIKDKPEDIGLHRDGADEDPAAAESAVDTNNEWTPGRALRTKQFWFMVVAGIAYAVPWGVAISHGKLHMQDKGMEVVVAAAIIGIAGWFSIVGRLSGVIGDKISPQKVAAVALVLEGIGMAGFYFVQNKLFGYSCIFLIGVGFGATYISIPVIFSDFFGRKAFATTAGVRILITGVFNGLGPKLAGRMYDQYESYFIPFMTLSVICFVGAVAAALSKHPGPPNRPAEEVEMEKAA